MNSTKAILVTIIISFFIATIIIVQITFNKMDQILLNKEKNMFMLNEKISELEYKLLNCRLNTINELNAKKEE